MEYSNLLLVFQMGNENVHQQLKHLYETMLKAVKQKMCNHLKL